MYSSRYFLNLIEPIDIQKRAFYPKKYNLLPINKFKNIYMKYIIFIKIWNFSRFPVSQQQLKSHKEDKSQSQIISPVTKWIQNSPKII